MKIYKHVLWLILLSLISQQGYAQNFSPLKCYQIINKATNKALEVKDASQDDGAFIQQSTISTLGHQLWSIGLDGTYSITSSVSDGRRGMNALDCTEGGQVQNNTFVGIEQSRWVLEAQTDGTYKIRSVACNKYLSVSSSTDPSVRLKIDVASDLFKWTIKEVTCLGCGGFNDIRLSTVNPKASNTGSITITNLPPVVTAASSINDGPFTVGKTVYSNLGPGTYKIRITDGGFFCENSTIVTLVRDITPTCTNFPVPQITVTIASTTQGSSISIANVPVGATSSITPVTSAEIPDVLNNVYRAKMQLNGCTSEKLIRQSSNRNFEEQYSPMCYRIVNKATGKVLEVVGNSQAEDAAVRLGTANGGSNQLWQIVSDASGLRGFISKSSGKWLSVNGPACTDGTSLKQMTNKFITSQRFSTLKAGMLATCFGTNKFLKADANGLNVVVATGDTTNAFQWIYEETPCPVVNCPTIPAIAGASTVCVGSSIQLTAPSIKENASWAIGNAGTQGTITSDGTVKALRVGTATVGFIVIEGGCLNRVTKTLTFQDCAVPSFDPNKCYRIVNKATNKVLELKNASSAEGTQIYQWTSTTNRKQQLWQIKKRSDGKYNIVAKSTGKLMDAPDCTEGGLIKEFAADGTGSQNWSLEAQADGSYKILNQTCNKYIRVEGSNLADGHEVGVKNDFGADSFKWFVKEADCTTGAALSATAATFSFEARADEGRAKLQWITNTSDKTDYFEIERLNQQGNFEVLGRQNAEGGSDLKSYTFTDNSPYDGDNFYRINTVFQNAPPQYSDVKKVIFAKNEGVNIYPNPADDYISVDLRHYEGKTVSLSFYNSVGLMVKKQTIEKAMAAPQQVDVQGFATGSYLLRVQSEGKREVTRLFNIAK